MNKIKDNKKSCITKTLINYFIYLFNAYEGTSRGC